MNAAWRDYGNRAGAFRLFDRLSGIGIRLTVLLNTDVYDEAPEVLAAARAVSAEFVGHGRSNSDSLNALAPGTEAAYVAEVFARIEAQEGVAPGGWSSPWLSHTPTSLASLSAAGYRYLLDLKLDDQPVWLDTGAGRMLAIPYGCAHPAGGAGAGDLASECVGLHGGDDPKAGIAKAGLGSLRKAVGHRDGRP